MFRAVLRVREWPFRVQQLMHRAMRLFHRALWRCKVWLFSRRLRLLLQGAPALILVAFIAGLFWTGAVRPPQALIQRYAAAVDQALAREHLDVADLFLQKLVQLNDTSPKTRFRQAMLAHGRQQGERAERVLRELAPDDATGYAPAHFWIAKNMMQQKRSWTRDKTEVLVHHLRASLSSPAHRVQARQMLGQVHLARREFSEAAEAFQAIVDERPEVRLTLGRIHRTLGNAALADRHLDRAAAFFEEELEAKPDDARARIGLAQALHLRGDFAQAERVLQEGLSSSRDDLRRKALAALYVSQFDRLAKSSAQDAGTQWKLLQRALQLAPDMPDALIRLAAFVRLDGDQAAEARESIEDRLAAGGAPAILHLILGTMAAQERNLAKAELHLEQAYRSNPNTPGVLNNLAWVLANTEPPQLDRALELANAATDALPDHPELHETRGQILVRLQRWQDALPDLEAALHDLGSRKTIHESLATVYEQVGDEAMSAKHRQLAESCAQQTEGD